MILTIINLPVTCTIIFPLNASKQAIIMSHVALLFPIPAFLMFFLYTISFAKKRGNCFLLWCVCVIVLVIPVIVFVLFVVGVYFVKHFPTCSLYHGHGYEAFSFPFFFLGGAGKEEEGTVVAYACACGTVSQDRVRSTRIQCGYSGQAVEENRPPLKSNPGEKRNTNCCNFVFFLASAILYYSLLRMLRSF